MIAAYRAWMTTRAALTLAIVGVVGLTLLASACGGSSGANVAQIGRFRTTPCGRVAGARQGCAGAALVTSRAIRRRARISRFRRAVHRYRRTGCGGSPGAAMFAPRRLRCRRRCE